MTPAFNIAVVAALALLCGPLAVAQDFSADHLQAAEELLVLTDTEATMEAAMDEMLRVQLDQNPGLAPFEGVMRDFFDEHLSWESVKDELIVLYADTFTEDELREIAAFYRTPVGQKAIATLPRLMAQGMQIGQRSVQENLPELERRVQARMKELEGKD